MIIRFFISVFLFAGIAGFPWHLSGMHAGESKLYKDESPKTVILQKAKEQLTARYSSDSYRFSVKSRWIPGSLLQKDVSILSVELEGGIRRYTNFNVVYERHQRKRRSQIQLVVKTEKKVPVVMHRITTGSVIKKDDLGYQWVTLQANRSELIDDMDRLRGKTLRRTLLAGQPVRESYISKEYVIEAGDEVKVIVKRNGIQVHVTGEARESGAKGDKIRIYSEETRRKYVGEVIRPGITLWKSTL